MVLVMCHLCPQASASTPLSSFAGSESVHKRRHYHPDLPTASQGLLQLYHGDAPEDLGPKAVSFSPKSFRYIGGTVLLDTEDYHEFNVPNKVWEIRDRKW